MKKIFRNFWSSIHQNNVNDNIIYYFKRNRVRRLRQVNEQELLKWISITPMLF